MYVLISVIILMICILLVLVVLVQNSKGGGLAANFAGSNQMMGVRKTADFLEKATWTLATSLIILSVLASYTIPKGEALDKSDTFEEVEDFEESPINRDALPMPSDFEE